MRVPRLDHAGRRIPLQGLTSILPAGLHHLGDDLRGPSPASSRSSQDDGPRPAWLAALAALVAVLLLGFYLNAYYQLHLEQRFERTSADNISWQFVTDY